MTKIQLNNELVDSNIDFCLLFSTEKRYTAPDSIYHAVEIHRNIDALDDE